MTLFFKLSSAQFFFVSVFAEVLFFRIFDKALGQAKAAEDRLMFYLPP